MHAQWCKVIMEYQKKMVEKVGQDMEVNSTEWEARPTQPAISMKIIEGRKMEELPMAAACYYPPAAAAR